MLQATIPRWGFARALSQSDHTSATRLSAPTSHYDHLRRQVSSGHGIFDTVRPQDSTRPGIEPPTSWFANECHTTTPYHPRILTPRTIFLDFYGPQEEEIRYKGVIKRLRRQARTPIQRDRRMPAQGLCTETQRLQRAANKTNPALSPQGGISQHRNMSRELATCTHMQRTRVHILRVLWARKASQELYTARRTS